MSKARPMKKLQGSSWKRQYYFELWHKIAATMMVKLGIKKIKLTPEDIRKMDCGNINLILDFDDETNVKGITLAIFDDAATEELFRKQDEESSKT